MLPLLPDKVLFDIYSKILNRLLISENIFRADYVLGHIICKR